jgi:hypothetical protein
MLFTHLTSMEKTVTIIRYAVAALLVAILGGVAGWYFYVRQNAASNSAIDQGRGLSAQTPSFDGQSGSNAQNVQASKEIPVGTSTVVQAAGRLWRADQGPIAGYAFIAPPKGTSATHLYFAERANGYVFDADVAASSVTRLTNTLIPKTYEAVFAPKGGVALMRTVNNGSVTTLLGSFGTPPKATTFPEELGGPTLPSQISAIAVDADPAKNGLFYLAPGKGGTVGQLSTLANAKPKQIFSSPISSWHTQLISGTVYLLLSPSDGIDGYAYTLGADGSMSKLVGPQPGLMIAPHPLAQALLYSSSAAGHLSLFTQIKKGTPSLLPLATIAEKCLWAPGKSLTLYCAVPKGAVQTGFIDAWYQGSLHTADSWWQIDAMTGATTKLFEPSSAIDVHDPQIDPSGSYLAFINGVDESLWVLKIAQ